MRGRRVISLLLSLVMALSLCSGVWADNEVTASDEGVIVNYAERTVRFYPVMNGGYLKYDPDDPDELKIDGRNIDYTVGEDTRTIPAFFIRATGDLSSAHLFLAIDKNEDETTVPTLLSSDGWLTLRNENSNDGGKFVYALSVAGNRNNGDTAFITLDGQTTPFAIVFEKNNGSEGGSQQGSALGDVDRDGNTLIVKSVNDVGDTIELPIDWQDNWREEIQNIGLTDGALDSLKSFNKDVFIACRWGVQLTLPKDVIADMADKVTGDNKLWIVTDYRNQDAPDEEGGKAVAFRTQFYIGKGVGEGASKYALPEGKSYQFGIDASGRNGNYELYCPNDKNSALVKQTATINIEDIHFESESDLGQRVTISVDHDGMFVLAPVGYTIQQTWPWDGAGVAAWDPDDAFNAENAPAYVQELYKLGYKTPAYNTNFHLELPWQLHGTDNPSTDGHWDYKWSLDKTTGIVTIELNTDHEECWKDCVKNNTDIFTDGVYFHYWVGGSDTSTNLMDYGAHNGGYFEPADEPTEVNLDNLILTGDYEISNGWQLATVNKRSTTSTVLTFNAGTLCYFEGFAMSDNEDNNRKPMSSAEYKYIVQINVVTDKTKAVKLETEESQNVPKDRIAFSTVGNVPADKWKCEVTEDGKAFVLYSGNEDYTKATAATEVFNGKSFSNMIGFVSIKVPDGYTTLNYVVDAGAGNYISSYSSDYSPIDLAAKKLASVSFPVFKEHYNSIKLVWSDSTGKTLTESLLVEMGNATPWMELLQEGTQAVTKPTQQQFMDDQTKAFLEENGIYVTYDPDLGYFSTRVDASKLKDLSALNCAAALTPMQGAAYFKVFGFGGSEAPFAHGQERAALAKANLDDWTTPVIPVSDLNSGVLGFFTQLLQTDSIKINVGNDELTVYFAANQLFRGGVIQWLDENENVLGYTYVYGRNGDFVTSVPTETKAEVNEAVGAPTLEWDGDTDPGFTCDRNPQTGGNGSKVFFQFSVKHTNGIDAQRKAVIYLPYDYFGITAAEGMRRAARGERPVIYHYLDESCANEPEVIYGEYTPYGVKFETGSFSPFVVDCSTTSTTHRYHSTAAKADSPETFDGGIALYGALAVTSLTGMAYVTKKRED